MNKKNRTVSFSRELLLNIMNLDNFEMRIALLAFYHEGKFKMSFDNRWKLGKWAGFTPEENLFKGYDFNNIINFSCDEDTEVTTFWVNEELLRKAPVGCHGDCANCEDCEDN